MLCNPFSNLLSHAKRHCPRKQFLCSECPYSCVDRNAMQTHIANKHVNLSSKSSEPINFLDEDLKLQWIETMKKCFPKFCAQIDKYSLTETDLNTEIVVERGNLQQQKEGETLRLNIDLGMSGSSGGESSTDSTQQGTTLNIPQQQLNRHLFGVRKKLEHESSPQLPLFDVQFNQEGCISKIRTLKRRNSENSSLLLEEGLLNSLEKDSRSPSPNDDVLPLKRRCRPRR